MKIRYFAAMGLIGMLAACKPVQKAVVPAGETTSLSVNGKMFTAYFQQRAAEYAALCYQAYNVARLRVDALTAIASAGKPMAIVTDIDETVLDNSPYAAHQGLLGKDYDIASWAQWSDLAQADSIPGAPSFFKYAASKGLEVFYISNRENREMAATLKNLRQFGFPFADSAHLLLKQTSSGKEPRRQQVLASHNIVMLCGDNLADFTTLYDKKSMAERLAATQQLTAEFGNRFIVIPNANYGDWESSLYGYNYKLTTAQKDSAIRQALKKY